MGRVANMSALSARRLATRDGAQVALQHCPITPPVRLQFYHWIAFGDKIPIVFTWVRKGPI